MHNTAVDSAACAGIVTLTACLVIKHFISNALMSEC